MGFILILIFVFNIFDALATLYAINNLYAIETNFLMDYLIRKDAILFLATKLLVGGLFVGLMHYSVNQKNTKKVYIKSTIYSVFTIYLLLTIYHIVGYYLYGVSHG